MLALVKGVLDEDETIVLDRQKLAKIKEIPVEVLCAKDART